MALKFEHSPLQRPSEQIRLLKIEPGEDIIELKIDHYDLLDCPKYVAVSYEWGPEEESSDVAVALNGKSFSVRKNLGAALEALRRLQIPSNGGLFDTATPNFWVDAVCIMQDNADEKSHQLNLMGRLFHKASQSIAWLGPAHDTSDVAMSYLRDLGSTTEYFFWEHIKDLQMMELLAVKKLFGRSYWKRIWIVQEVLLSQNLYFICGNSFCTWMNLRNFEMRQGKEFHEITEPHELVDNLRYSKTLVNEHLQIGLSDVSIMACIMYASENRLSTFLEDRVYAFLGPFQLGPKALTGVEVKYNLRAEDLMIRFAKFVNRNNEGARPIYHDLASVFERFVSTELLGRTAWFGQVSEVLHNMSVQVLGNIRRIYSISSDENFVLLLHTFCWIMAAFGIDLGLFETEVDKSDPSFDTKVTGSHGTSKLSCQLIKEDESRREIECTMLWKYHSDCDSRSFTMKQSHRSWVSFTQYKSWSVKQQEFTHVKKLLKMHDENYQTILTMRPRMAGIMRRSSANRQTTAATSLPVHVRHVIFTCLIARVYLELSNETDYFPERNTQVWGFTKNDETSGDDLDSFLSTSLFGYYDMEVKEKSEIESHGQHLDREPVQTIEVVETTADSKEKIWVASLFRKT